MQNDDKTIPHYAHNNKTKEMETSFCHYKRAEFSKILPMI